MTLDEYNASVKQILRRAAEDRAVDCPTRDVGPGQPHQPAVRATPDQPVGADAADRQAQYGIDDGGDSAKVVMLGTGGSAAIVQDYTLAALLALWPVYSARVVFIDFHCGKFSLIDVRRRSITAGEFAGSPLERAGNEG